MKILADFRGNRCFWVKSDGGRVGLGELDKIGKMKTAKNDQN